MFASCACNIQIHLWPSFIVDEKIEFNSKCNKSNITHLSWCNDNTYMCFLQEHEKPQVIATKDLNNVHLVHTINVSREITSMVFKNNTKRNLALGTKDGAILLYDTKAREICKTLPKLTTQITHLDFNYDDQYLGVLSNKKLVMYDNETIVNEYKLHNQCTSMKFHPNSADNVIVGCDNGSVTQFDTKTATKLLNSRLHSETVTGLAISQCKNFLISSSNDHHVCVTDIATGECQFRINAHLPITSMDLRSDDKIIAVGLEDGSIVLYDLNYIDKPLLTSKCHDSHVNRVIFTNDVRDCTYVNSLISFVTLSDKNAPDLNIENNPNSRETWKTIVKGLFKMVKIQSQDLENQLSEHCQRFKNFVSSEFILIDKIIKDKWGIFDDDDVSGIHGLNSEALLQN